MGLARGTETDQPRADGPDTTRPDIPVRAGWRTPMAIAFGAAGVAAAGLGRRSLWLDEAFSVGAIRDLVPTVRGTGGTMAAYYLLLAPWAAVSTDLVWLRLLSVLVAVAAVPVVHGVAGRLGGRRLAWLSSGVLGFSWLFTRYAQEVRSYALVILLVSLSWWALIRAVTAGPGEASRWWWRLFATATVLGVLSHGLTGLQLLAQVVALALAPDARIWLRRILPLAFAVVLVVGTLTTFGASGVANWVPPLSTAQLHELLASFTGPSLVAQVVLGGTILVGARAAWRRFRAGDDAWLHLVVLLWALVPPLLLIGLSALRPYLIPRYAIGSVPGMAILIGLALTSPAEVWRRTAWTATVALILAAGQLSLHQNPGDDWRGAAAYLRTQAEAGDHLLVPAPFLRSPLDYAWEGSAPPRLIPLSPTDAIGPTRRFHLYIAYEKLADAMLAAPADRIWIVDQEAHDIHSIRVELLSDPDLIRSFEIVETQRFEGEISVLLLRRR